MCGLLSRNTIIGFALFLSVPLFGFGCGNFDQGLGGGGADKSGSLFNVEYIDPTYFEDSTRQVDVFLNPNCSNDPDEPDPEPYSDHFADVTFTNRPLNNSLETPPTIYLYEYWIWYTPLTQGSPPLDSFTVMGVGDQGGIEGCDPGSQCAGETLSQIQFVPVREKEVLAGYILSTGIFQLEYNIHYRFFGRNVFGYEVSAEAITNFYASNYDNCGG